MTVLLLDADAAGDCALENSHWVAEQSAKRLSGPSRSLRGQEVTRASLEEQLQDAAIDGVCYFGHGTDRALLAPSGAVLDLDNLHLVGERWLHAFACNSGNSLAMTASREGVGAYLGYNRPIIVEWTASGLPDEVALIVSDVVTAATRYLADGGRSRGALRRAVRDAHDAWIAWRLDHEEVDLPLIERMGIDALVRLSDQLEFEGVQVAE